MKEDQIIKINSFYLVNIINILYILTEYIYIYCNRYIK